MKILTSLALAIAVSLIVGNARLDAQDPVGAIEGAIADSSAAAVAAHVAVKNLDTDTTRETVADADGHFRLAQIPIGRYSVTVEAPHFATLVQQPITVNISQNVRLQFTLAVFFQPTKRRFAIFWANSYHLHSQPSAAIA